MAGMLCAICRKKPATVHLTQIVGEQMQKRGLCEDCANAKGVNDPLFAPTDVMPDSGVWQGTKLIPGIADLKLRHVISARAKKYLLANSWRIITP